MDTIEVIVKTVMSADIDDITYMKKNYFIAGEMSGDFIGGRIMQNLKDNRVLSKLPLEVEFGKNSTRALEFVGVGGKYMEEAGMIKSLFHISEINLMGFIEVVPHIFKIKKIINKTIDDIINNKPDLLITIDSPGFTYRVAKLVRNILPKLKMIHIVVPSVWAYNEGRAVNYAKIYDCLFALLPFEPPFFTKVGLDCRYIGHPIMEQEFYSNKTASRAEFKIQYNLDRSRQDEFQCKLARRIGIFEQRLTSQNSLGLSFMNYAVDNDAKILCVTLGSEILRHLPIFIGASQKVYDDYKNLIIIFTLTNSNHESIIKPFLENVSSNYFFTNERLKSYAVADIALAKSGTNTLEIAASGTPMIVAYKVNIFSFFIIRLLIKIKYITLINIIAASEIIPEFIQFNCKASLNSNKLKELLLNSQKTYEQVIECQKNLQQLGFKSNNSSSYVAAKIIKQEFLN